MEKSDLKLRIIARRLSLQQQKLEAAIERFGQRDKALYARVVDALSKQDKARAYTFSNELIEVRKMEQTLIKSEVTISKVIMELRSHATMDSCLLTVAIVWERLALEAASALGVSVLVLATVQKELVSIFPEAHEEIGELRNILSGIMVETAAHANMTLDFSRLNDDAIGILNAASEATRQKIASLPEVKLP